MGKPTGFLEIERKDRGYDKPAARKRTWKEFVHRLPGEEVSTQAARCMNCGIPYCHGTGGSEPGVPGCPVNNLIPDWNDLVYRGKWRQALETLHATNNFPEFTGRICPAPCEASCTLNIQETPVAIKTIECEIIDRAWDEGWVVPEKPAQKSGKSVAVIGSGPAGLACAQQLARAGHQVTVFERQDRIGGLLRYGIPDFKLEKRLIDRRVRQMEQEGVTFKTECNVGVDIAFDKVRKEFDAVVLAAGAEAPRDLEAEGRGLTGIYFAMDFLRQQNKRNAGDEEARAAPEGTINAKGKKVVVIGGGDTGSDCIGTSIRQGAASVTQIEIMPRPPEQENKPLVWPDWPLKLRTSSSQEEGAARDWSILTKRIRGENGAVTALECVRVEWVSGADGRQTMQEVEGSAFEIEADLVFLAMGFTGPVREGLITGAKVALDARGAVAANRVDYASSVPGVFACGDVRRGQSLVVWAIREGRDCAAAVHAALQHG